MQIALIANFRRDSNANLPSPNLGSLRPDVLQN